jgi:thiosulfate reductase cytochrome b subunit
MIHPSVQKYSLLVQKLSVDKFLHTRPELTNIHTAAATLSVIFHVSVHVQLISAVPSFPSFMSHIC